MDFPPTTSLRSNCAISSSVKLSFLVIKRSYTVELFFKKLDFPLAKALPNALIASLTASTLDLFSTVRK